MKIIYLRTLNEGLGTNMHSLGLGASEADMIRKYLKDNFILFDYDRIFARELLVTREHFIAFQTKIAALCHNMAEILNFTVWPDT